MMPLANFVAFLKRIFTIDKGMILCKIAYFLMGCHLGCYQPYLNIFFVSVGTTKEQSGMLTGLMFVLPIVASPVWGLIVDFTGKRKHVLLLMVYGGSFLFSALPWIAHSLNPINRSKLHLKELNSTNGSYAFHDSEISKNGFGSGYGILVAVILFTSIFNMPLPIFVDTIGMNVVKNNKNGAIYATQRCFWIIGGLTGVFLSGVASNYFKHPYLSPFTGVFILFLSATVPIFPIGCILINQGEYHVRKEGNMVGQGNVIDDITSDNGSHLIVDNKTQNVEKLTFKDIIEFHFRLEIFIFLTTVFLTGCSHFLFLNTAYLHMDEKWNVTKIEMTYVFNAGTISSFIFTVFSSKIISILGGPIRAIGLGIFISSIRYFIISFDISFTLFLCVQISTGLTFSVPWNASMEYCNTISPRKMYATTNAVMLTVYRFLTNIAASVLGLKIYAMVGGWKLYFIFSTVCFAWFVFLFFYYEAKNIIRYCKQRGQMIENNEIEVTNTVKS